jgi:hypothetical protein
VNPQDEFIHPARDERGWSESYYFYFADHDQKIFLFTRMGLRPGDGWGDGLHVMYLGGDRIAFTYSRIDLPEVRDILEVGGLKLERIEPTKKWAINYDGPAQDIADAPILVTRRRERPEGWFRPAHMRMRVEFDALSDAHYSAQGVHGHFEQPGECRGWLEVDNEKWQLHGYGVRDKSWGPRTWQAGSGGGSGGGPKSTPEAPKPFVNWMAINFGPDLSMAYGCSPSGDGTLRGGGWVQTGSTIQALNDAWVEPSKYRPGSFIHSASRTGGTAADGTKYDIDFSVITVCPTKIAMPNGATLVNEGVAEYRLGDRVGYGIAEYWHSVELPE